MGPPSESALACVATPPHIVLRDECWHVVVQPEAGGSLQHCEFRGMAVMQPAAELPGDGRGPLTCCYFPMIPFVNRIENGEFTFDGRAVRLNGNVAGTRHAMHGHGWQTDWRVVHVSPVACGLSYRHEAGDGWPWPYEGTQSFEIFRNQLRILLGIRNLSSSPMPCGLGFHPFLPAGDDAHLQFTAARAWNGIASNFPRQRVAVPRDICFGAGAPVALRGGTDHCYDGWSRRAVVRYESPRRTIVIEGCDATDSLIAYVCDRGFFCVEPVTHAVNAFNFPEPASAGLWTLEPGERRQIAMVLRVEMEAVSTEAVRR